VRTAQGSRRRGAKDGADIERSTVRTHPRASVGALLGVGAALALAASPASAAVAYTTPTGEAISTLAASNGITADQLASWNGLSPYTSLSAGQSIYIPSPSELGVSTTSTATTTPTATTTTASTGASRTVVAGDTLTAIAAANGVSASSLAAANGISLDSVITTGQTLAIPAATTTATSTSTSTTTSSTASSSGLAPIYCPCGTDYLSSAAASAWDAMRQDALSTYGVDLYPNGPLSAYRSYDQQSYLYNLYLSGQGAPANPPGTSPHEYGDSVDLASPEMRSIVDSIGGQFGWGKIYGPTEWWHVDYTG
jgi:LysM repeat protein